MRLNKLVREPDAPVFPECAIGGVIPKTMVTGEVMVEPRPRRLRRRCRTACSKEGYHDDEEEASVGKSLT